MVMYNLTVEADWCVGNHMAKGWGENAGLNNSSSGDHIKKCRLCMMDDGGRT